jgi:hypothetical protein
MKYVVTWVSRASATEQTIGRGLQVFSKWSPSEGNNFKEFLGRIDGQGGFAFIETDDPSLIAKDIAAFTGFFDFTVHPVQDITETAAQGAEAIAFLASIQ